MKKMLESLKEIRKLSLGTNFCVGMSCFNCSFSDSGSTDCIKNKIYFLAGEGIEIFEKEGKRKKEKYCSKCGEKIK